MTKKIFMKNVIKNLILLLLLIVLSGCAKRRIGPIPLRERAIQARNIMEDLQDFIIEVSSSDNNSCQMEVADSFMNTEIHIFSERLFFDMGLENVVDAIHQVMSGKIEPETAPLLRSLNVRPHMYRNDGIMHTLETTPQTKINHMRSELDALKEVWANCLENGPSTTTSSSRQEQTVNSQLPDEEQAIKDLFVFWRDNMITTTPDNNCQRQIKTRLNNNRTLVSFIMDYYSFDFDVFPSSGPTDLDEQDVNIKEEFEALEFIWNGCEVEGETPEKTDFQNKAERLTREVLTYWINNMIPLEDDNSCQQYAKNFTETNDTLSVLITYFFRLDDTTGDLIDYFDSEEQFLDEMGQNLNTLQNNPCL